MEQLSGLDSFFLYEEQGNNYSHVAALGVYDPSTAPAGKVRFREILNHFAAHLDVNPLFHRRLATVPLDLDRPYWVDDPDIDLEFHIRHIALPAPGDWRQLMILVARLHSRRLDRSKPLWEVYVIDGLHRIPGLSASCFAIFIKLHHASVDGVAGMATIAALHASSAQPEILDKAREVTRLVHPPPSAVAMYSRALHNASVRLAGFPRLALGALKTVGARAYQAVQERSSQTHPDWRGLLSGITAAPVTRFNHPISAHRVLGTLAWPLATIVEIRNKVQGVTVNDVFLATVGGGLRTYLDSKRELPERSLIAAMPISLRLTEKGEGNQVGSVPVSMFSDIADPVERLQATHHAALKAKHDGGALGLDLPKDLIEMLPHFVGDIVVRQLMLPQLNVAVSNVRGPEEALYVAGARLMQIYPVSMPTDYVGLNHTAISYNGTLWISLVACREQLPDPGFYIECLQGSFDQLVAATNGLPRPHPPRRASVTRKPTAKPVTEASAVIAEAAQAPARPVRRKRVSSAKFPTDD